MWRLVGWFQLKQRQTEGLQVTTLRKSGEFLYEVEKAWYILLILPTTLLQLAVSPLHLLSLTHPLIQICWESSVLIQRGQKSFIVLSLVTLSISLKSYHCYTTFSRTIFSIKTPRLLVNMSCLVSPINSSFIKLFFFILQASSWHPSYITVWEGQGTFSSKIQMSLTVHDKRYQCTYWPCHTCVRVNGSVHAHVPVSGYLVPSAPWLTLAVDPLELPITDPYFLVATDHFPRF